MFNEEKKLEKILRMGRKIIPKSIFRALQPIYHWGLSLFGATAYRFPSRSMKVIGITGTKGKSTTVYMTTKVLEDQGYKVAAIGSLGVKIADKEWPNTLKMTMPGRLKLQRFLYQARKAGCQFVVLEVTSEGLRQMRHIGIKFDSAVFTNLSREHIESHGGFENYRMAKEKLFKATRNTHILDVDDSYIEKFVKFKARRKIFYGLTHGDVAQTEVNLKLKLAGEFNIYNALAAFAIAKCYGLDLDKTRATLEGIASISGRMEYIVRDPFRVIVDYAHTPDSLEAVYKTIKPHSSQKLICVLGAAGGGRDRWKRPVFGEIAGRYCDEILLTNEDPFDEDPQKILDEVKEGIKDSQSNVRKVMDRGEAIREAINTAQPGDVVIITGKGSETSIALAGGKKISWSDKEEAEKALKNLGIESKA